MFTILHGSQKYHDNIRTVRMLSSLVSKAADTLKIQKHGIVYIDLVSHSSTLNVIRLTTSSPGISAYVQFSKSIKYEII